MGVYDKMKEGAKDLGRKMLGQSREVNFKNQVEERAEAAGWTREQAEKDIFDQYVGDLEASSKYQGKKEDSDRFEKSSLEFRAALNEMFGGKKLEEFKRLSADPAIARPLTLAAAPRLELDRVRRHFADKYGQDLADKNRAAAADTLDALRSSQSLLLRINGDPRVAGAPDIRAALAGNPELGADIGRILAGAERIRGHEKRLAKDEKFDQSIEAFKNQLKESLTEMVWNAPVDFARKIFSSKDIISFGGFAKAFGASMKFLGREVWSGGKLLLRGADIAVKGLTKLAG